MLYACPSFLPYLVLYSVCRSVSVVTHWFVDSFPLYFAIHCWLIGFLFQDFRCLHWVSNVVYKFLVLYAFSLSSPGSVGFCVTSLTLCVGKRFGQIILVMVAGSKSGGVTDFWF